MVLDGMWRLGGVISGFADWLGWLLWSVVALIPLRYGRR
jgi:hypothetical protein